MIDRATRWLEAVPLVDITAATVANAFVSSWISRFGVPLYVISDRGAQFESELFSNLSQILGFFRLRTTSYHPQTNGMVERVHRTLKTAILARKQSWLSALPIVLLGLRSIPNDTGFSPFTTVTGSQILLPQLMISPNNPQYTDVNTKELAKEMQYMSIKNLSEGRFNNVSHSYIPKELNSCKEVWLRIDRVRRSLEAPYSGPFEVLRRGPKIFTIKLPTGESHVSIDRLKPVMKRLIEADGAMETRFVESTMVTGLYGSARR